MSLPANALTLYPCPTCDGRGRVRQALAALVCAACRGTGVTCACGNPPSLIRHYAQGVVGLCADCLTDAAKWAEFTAGPVWVIETLAGEQVLPPPTR